MIRTSVIKGLNTAGPLKVVAIYLLYLTTYVSIMAWPGFKANLLQESHGHKIIILTLSSKSYICLVFDMIPNNNAVNGINDNGHISSSDNNS